VGTAGPAALLVAILGSVPAPWCAANPTEVTPPSDDISRQALVTAIDALNALDPQSPETLDARLQYADFLAKAEDEDCRTRLDAAQSQLDLVRASPAVSLALPWGAARQTDLEYQIHFARADCGSSAAVREQELRAALDSARRAVDLYRDALDAVSMATMQFNASLAYRSLGDNDAAVAALQVTLAMDREYGFVDDAEENYRLLLDWKNEAAGPDEVAARMQNFPDRSTTLRFGWFEGTAEAALETDYSQLANGRILHLHSVRRAQRKVHKGLQSWVVSYQPGETHYDLDTPPNEDPSTSGFANTLTRMLLQFHDFSVARNGDFNEDKGGFKFEARVNADVKTLKRELASRSRDLASKSDRAKPLARSIDELVNATLPPGVLEYVVAEDYNLQVGTWIDATLEQGVWYDMAAPLSLPLAPNLFTTHKIQFAFTRFVPCTADATESACAEIVLRATPDPAAIKAILDYAAHKARLPRGQMPRLWSVTYMRLVTDPATLQPYTLDARRHSYWSLGAKDSTQSLTEFERTVFVSGRMRR
jgi:tetratricopeptide (TPR) repeat protein